MTRRDALTETNAGRTDPIGFPLSTADDARGRRAMDARRAGTEFEHMPTLAPIDVRGGEFEHETHPDADPRAVDYIE